jgi:hypothetical protein
MDQGALLARCACGWQVKGSVDRVVSQTQEHARRVHNMHATREEVLAQAVPIAAAEVTQDQGRGAGDPTR